MTRELLLARRDYFNLVHGVTVRAIAASAWQYFLFAYDEHWHHRGQLYVYLRLLGKEPPNLYDY